MGGYIDFYVVTRIPDTPQDFTKALNLVAGDDEAEWFINNLKTKVLGGPQMEDGDDVQVINGVTSLILQYHNGVGDGGDQGIANAEWFANTYPAALKAMGLRIAWGKGTAALVGNPVGVVP